MSVSGLSENSHQKFSKVHSFLPYHQNCEPRDISENIIELELGTNCHSLKNISSTLQKQDTLISFCQSEPNFCNPSTFSTSDENLTNEDMSWNNLDYHRYGEGMVMGSGELEAVNEGADYNFVKMMSEDCGCSLIRIPGRVKKLIIHNKM